MLIEQSIAKQYGVLPSRQGELHYADWAKLVSGLMEDTPLGCVVAIRSERDRNVLRGFTPAQREIRAEWRDFVAEKQARQGETEMYKKQMKELEQMMAGLFGGGE